MELFLLVGITGHVVFTLLLAASVSDNKKDIQALERDVQRLKKAVYSSRR